jgi:hypothetical protein
MFTWIPEKMIFGRGKRGYEEMYKEKLKKSWGVCF